MSCEVQSRVTNRENKEKVNEKNDEMSLSLSYIKTPEISTAIY